MKAFGRRHSDLGPRIQADVSIRHTTRLRADIVHDRPDQRATLTRGLHRRQRVDGLAGLRDGQHGGPLIEQRIGVAHLGADFDLHREPGQPLEIDPTDQARIV